MRFKRLTAIFGMACLTAGAVGCAGEDGQDGQDGEDGDKVTVTDIEAGEICEYGGQQVAVGTQIGPDGNVDPDDPANEVHYICDGAPGEAGAEGPEGPAGEPGEPGEPGEDGESVLVESEANEEDESCTDFTFGYDTDDDGEIDDVVETATVCDGDSPEITTETEPAAADACDSGSGTVVYFEANGTEIGEITVCDGAGEGGGGVSGCSAVIEVGEQEDGCRDISTHYEDFDGNICETFDTDTYTVCDGCPNDVVSTSYDAGEGDCTFGGVNVQVYNQSRDADGQCSVQENMVDEFDICNGEDAQDPDSCEPAPFADCSGADLSDRTLQGISAQYADFTDADLSGTTLSGAIQELDGSLNVSDYEELEAALKALGGANFHQADFSGADLTNSDLQASIFTNANFEGATVTNAFTNYAAFRGADFTDAHLGGAGELEPHLQPPNNWDVDPIQAYGVTWDNTTCPDLTNSSSHAANHPDGEETCLPYEYEDEDDVMVGVNPLRICQLRANGTCTGFETFPGDTANLVGDLTGMNFSNTGFPEGTDFTGAELAGAVFAGADVRGASFSGELDEICFSDDCGDGNVADNSVGTDFSEEDNDGPYTRLQGATFGTDLTDAEFDNAVAEEASFAGTTGEGTSFDGAWLADAVFTGAELYAVDFDYADLEGAQLDGADFGPVVEELMQEDTDGNEFLAAHTVNSSSFDCSNLENATFEGSDLHYADFSTSCTMTSVLSGGERRLDGTDFSDADLRGVAGFNELGWGSAEFAPEWSEDSRCPNFSWASNFVDTDDDNEDTDEPACEPFSNPNALDAARSCQLAGSSPSCQYGDLTDLSGDDATSVLFRLADREDAAIDGINLQNTILDNADLSGAMLTNAEFNDAHGEGTIFDDATLTGADFDSTSTDTGTHADANDITWLVDVSLDGTDLSDSDDDDGASFEGVIFEDVEFRDVASYRGASFVNANFIGSTDFVGETFGRDTNLRGACGLDFDAVEDVEWHEQTRCPHGTYSGVVSGADCSAETTYLRVSLSVRETIWGASVQDGDILTAGNPGAIDESAHMLYEGYDPESTTQEYTTYDLVFAGENADFDEDDNFDSAQSAEFEAEENGEATIGAYYEVSAFGYCPQENDAHCVVRTSDGNCALPFE